MAPPLKLVVLVSGGGTNLQAILDAIHAGVLHAEVLAVVSNRRRAFALERAEAADISTAYVPFKPYRDAGRSRESYDRDLAELIGKLGPDHIVCAGWMHIFTPAFLEVFPGKVINLHPALPGTFPGADGIGDAWAAWERGEIDRTGVMVHVVTPELDTGPVLATAEVVIHGDDTRDSLEHRIHAVEHELLVRVLRALSDEPNRADA